MNTITENAMSDERHVSPYAVQVEDVFYSYDHRSRKHDVLKGLNINVMRGQIYALLGPSGCGKSTILKCITGTIVPKRGHIAFPNKSRDRKIPGSGVGYMPQELALFGDLTTQETLWLFGMLNRVPPDFLTEHIKRLSNIFELAPANRLIANLSGGQQRRVSLVCALLHDAPLLVLDEPTVGLDPILRNIIWDYMIDLTLNNGTTILLTTHYIEEAKDAHSVGLMREGTLLLENSPSFLMNHFNEKTLERCFYRVCENKELKIDGASTSKGCHEFHSKNRSERKNVSSVSNLNFSLNSNVPSLIVKNARLVKRHYLQLFFQFALPSLIVSFMGVCIGTKIFDFPLGIFNEEFPQDLSVELLRHISYNRIEPTFFDDKESAIDFVKSGRSAMSLYIPAGFSECFRNRTELGIRSIEDIVKCGSVYLYADATNRIKFLEIQQMFISSFERFQMEYLRNYTNATPLIATIPMWFEKPVYGDTEALFSQFLVPSILLNAIYFLALFLAVFTLITEKQNGVLERFSVCGVTKIEVFFGQIFCSMAIVFSQVFIMLATQFALFETKMYGSYVLAVTLIVLQGLCGMLFGFFVSAIAQTVLAALIIVIGAYLSSLILCGFIWPLEGMPIAMRWIARFLPLTQTTEALRSVMSRGWGLEYFQVQMGLLSVVSWSAIFLVGSILIFRAQK